MPGIVENRSEGRYSAMRSESPVLTAKKIAKLWPPYDDLQPHSLSQEAGRSLQETIGMSRSLMQAAFLGTNTLIPLEEEANYRTPPHTIGLFGEKLKASGMINDDLFASLEQAMWDSDSETQGAVAQFLVALVADRDVHDEDTRRTALRTLRSAYLLSEEAQQAINKLGFLDQFGFTDILTANQERIELEKQVIFPTGIAALLAAPIGAAINFLSNPQFSALIVGGAVAIAVFALTYIRKRYLEWKASDAYWIRHFSLEHADNNISRSRDHFSPGQ